MNLLVASPGICLFVDCVCLVVEFFVFSHLNHLNIFIRDVKPENLLVGSPGSPTESIIHMVPNIKIIMIAFAP